MRDESAYSWLFEAVYRKTGSCGVIHTLYRNDTPVGHVWTEQCRGDSITWDATSQSGDVFFHDDPTAPKLSVWRTRLEVRTPTAPRMNMTLDYAKAYVEREAREIHT